MKRTIQSVLLAGSLAVGSAAFAQSDKAQGQAQKNRPRDNRDYARPGTAPSRDNQPG